MNRRSFLTRATPTAFALSLARGAARRRMIIDADTANEIDDLYAIARALLEPSFDVAGLSSAQWHTRLSPANSVEHSQRLNDEILRLMNRQSIPAPIGAEMMMGQPWGGDQPRDTPAARLMIREALAAKSEKLSIVSIGAVTNAASALKLAPEIVSKVRCYSMAAHFDSATGIWNKDEFNVRNDLNAFNYLLNLDGLELHIMPANVCKKLVFHQADTLARLSGKGGVWDYIAARWLSHSPQAQSWIMWDLALVEALARPDLAKEGLFKTPPENRRRDVHVYIDIDGEAMKQDFWRTANLK
ncbi:MAG: nucleoside hydrolase [Candidatus Solibacter sp.]|nr:nucleoside hydrolase [Candidatus Solibacter sp.]